MDIFGVLCFLQHLIQVVVDAVIGDRHFVSFVAAIVYNDRVLVTQVFRVDPSDGDEGVFRAIHQADLGFFPIDCRGAVREVSVRLPEVEVDPRFARHQYTGAVIGERGPLRSDAKIVHIFPADRQSIQRIGIVPTICLLVLLQSGEHIRIVVFADLRGIAVVAHGLAEIDKLIVLVIARQAVVLNDVLQVILDAV